MKKETFLDILEDIDEDLIDAVDEPTNLKTNENSKIVSYSLKRNMRKCVTVVACITLFIGVSAIYNNMNSPKLNSSSNELKGNSSNDTVFEHDSNGNSSSVDDNKPGCSSEIQDGSSDNTADGSAYDNLNSTLDACAKMDNSDLYEGIGSGMFVYNERTYSLVNNKEYLKEHSIPLEITEEQLGIKLNGGIVDSTYTWLGLLYEVKTNNDMDEEFVEKANNQTILILDDDHGKLTYVVDMENIE